MQFFDLSQQFNLNNIIVPRKTLEDLKDQHWFLSKIRVEYDCIQEHHILQGQAVLKSNQNIEIELEWQIVDTGTKLHVLFKGIETSSNDETQIIVKGAQLIDHENNQLSAQALRLWIDGTLLPLLPHIRKEIKARLNVWDYVEYDG